MRLLLDTQALLWFFAGDERMGAAARAALQDPASEVHLSAASVWEMAIKAGLGKLNIDVPVERYVREKICQGLRPLPVDCHHAAAVQGLPPHHSDPFDRLLAAQAMLEDLTLVSGDRIFKSYKVKLLW